MHGEEDFQATIRHLQSSNVMDRSNILQVLVERPCNDERILPYLEELTNDRTGCIICIPYQFAEIRWLAIHALAEEKKALGVREPVQFIGIGMPLKTEQLFHLRRKYNIETTESGNKASMEAYQILSEMGKVPLVDITLNHPDPKVKEYIFYNMDEDFQ